MSSGVPFIILTGFLGAGKTTVLNRVLGAQHSRRIAVIVNELGRIDIDGKLLKQRAGDVVELVGGCVCHEITTQEELWEGLQEVVDRSKPDVIVLETTGIAEPGPILEALSLLPKEERIVTPWAVVTVVDAEAGQREIDNYEEARQQVRDADRILFTKLDLAEASALDALHTRLDDFNTEAERAGFPPGDEGTAELVPWLLARGGVADGLAKSHHHHHSHGQLVAAAYQDDAPLLEAPLMALLSRWGPTLVRAKGFVNLAGASEPYLVEKAGDRTLLQPGSKWGSGPRRTEFVLIGEDLDPAAVKRQLWACRAPAD